MVSNISENCFLTHIRLSPDIVTGVGVPYRLKLLLNARTVVLGDEEVYGSGQRIAIQAAVGFTRHVDIAIGIGGNGGAKGGGSRYAELLGAGPGRTDITATATARR